METSLAHYANLIGLKSQNSGKRSNSDVFINTLANIQSQVTKAKVHQKKKYFGKGLSLEQKDGDCYLHCVIDINHLLNFLQLYAYPNPRSIRHRISVCSIHLGKLVRRKQSGRSSYCPHLQVSCSDTNHLISTRHILHCQ